MTAVEHTVADRVDRARTELSATRLATILALVAALGFLLVFVQEPLAHDSLHNFRHVAGVACH